MAERRRSRADKKLARRSRQPVSPCAVCERIAASRHPRLGRGRIDERRRARGDRGGADRKSDVEGKSVSVRVDLGGRRIIQQKKQNKNTRREQNRIVTQRSTY